MKENVSYVSKTVEHSVLDHSDGDGGRSTDEGQRSRRLSLPWHRGWSWRRQTGPQMSETGQDGKPAKGISVAIYIHNNLFLFAKILIKKENEPKTKMF